MPDFCEAGFPRMRSRTGVDIFNLSFLDMFACVLGAFVLILIMVAINIGGELAAETVAKRLAAAQSTFAEDNERVSGLEKIIADGRQWEHQGDELARQLRVLEQTKKQAEALKRLLAQGPSEESLQQEIQISERLQNNLAERMQIDREKTESRIRFKANNPAAAIPQSPRCFSITIQGAMDLKTGTVCVLYSSEWKRMLAEFRRIRADEYPLFIVKPSGADVFEKLRKSLDSNRVLYGFEPYTEFWNPVYVAHGRDPVLD